MLATLVADDPSALRIVPLGGLGEIGMNCLALEAGGDIVVIDCGVTFPSVDLGIDVLHPRFDWLIANRARVRGIVITHGHEDHIGALPYLLDLIDVPVYAPAHALALMELRLAEHQFDLQDLPLHEVRTRETFRLGAFEFEPIRVTHSITEATALAIRTPAGLVVHTGDFKLDPNPTDGEITDEVRLAELGDEGVRLLFSDSTGVDAPGTSLSEEVVGRALEERIREAEHRVVVGMFASNVQRLGLIGKIARRAGRSICLIGRSAMTHVRAGHDVGKLDWPGDLVVQPEVAATMKRREILYVATGTQAEPPAALTRLAAGTHHRAKVEAGDTVILSSRVIPGNDRPVIEMIGAFLRAGVHVIGRAQDPKIHASGHAHRDELLRMIQLTRPQAFIPVHGTRHHLERHAELARDAGVGDTLVIENGEVAKIGATEKLARDGNVEVGRVATFQGEPLADEVLRERALAARLGVAFVSLVLSKSGELVARPVVSTTGVVGPLDQDVIGAAEYAIERGVRDVREEDRGANQAFVEAARAAVRRTIEAETGQRPVVQISVRRANDRSGGGRS